MELELEVLGYNCGDEYFHWKLFAVTTVWCWKSCSSQWVTNVVWAKRILFSQRVLAEHLGFGELLILCDKCTTANSQAVKQHQTLSDRDKERIWKAPLEGEDWNLAFPFPVTWNLSLSTMYEILILHFLSILVSHFCMKMENSFLFSVLQNQEK